MEYILRFAIGYIILRMYVYYLVCFKDEKTIIGKREEMFTILLSVICAEVHCYRIPLLSLLMIVLCIVAESYIVNAIIHYKIAMAISFLSIGMSVQCQLVLFYTTFPECWIVRHDYKHFIMMGIFILIYGSIIMTLCLLYGNRKIRLKILVKEIGGSLGWFSLLLVLLCMLMVFIAMKSGRQDARIVAMIAIGILLLLFYIILYFVSKMTRYLDKIYAEEARLDEIKKTAHHYEELDDIYMKIKEIKHDLKNRLLEFEHLLENRQFDELLEKVKIASDEVANIDSEIYTNNPALNSILRAKAGLAKKRNIGVAIEVDIPTNISLSDGQLGIIFGNLFDNAIEACEQVAPESRYIVLTAKVEGEAIYIKMVNSKNEKIKTYAKRNDRGLGQMSVRRLFEDYEGYVSFTDKGDHYVAVGALNMQKCVNAL